MSYRLLLMLLLIGVHCVAGNLPRNAHNKSAADAWIKKTLLTKRTKNCLKLSVPLNQVKPATEFSWTVTVLKTVCHQKKLVSHLVCIGSLIHPQVVLTAAHYFWNTSTANLTVLAGAASNEVFSIPDKYLQERQIDSIVVHENFTEDELGNDLALLFLKEPFTMTKHVGSICLSPKFDESSNVNCILASWDLGNKKLTGRPHFTTYNTTLVRKGKCQRVLRHTGLGRAFKMSKDSICISGGLNNSAIWANGGGPLVCQICPESRQFVQVGVLSFGFLENELPSVLTNVKNHRKWIRTTSKERHFKIYTCLNRKRRNQ